MNDTPDMSQTLRLSYKGADALDVDSFRKYVRERLCILQSIGVSVYNAKHPDIAHILLIGREVEGDSRKDRHRTRTWFRRTWDAIKSQEEELLETDKVIFFFVSEHV